MDGSRAGALRAGSSAQPACSAQCASLAAARLVLLAFPVTLASLFLLVLTPNLVQCDAALLAVALCATLGVGGHFLAASLLAPAACRGVAWPRPAAAALPSGSAAGSLNDGAHEALLADDGGDGDDGAAAEARKPAPAAAPPLRRLALACALAPPFLAERASLSSLS